MRYFSEFKLNWKSLLATFIGIGTGSAIGHYTLSLFGPELIAEFGWSKADYALVGSLQIFTLLFTPFAGRFTDVVYAVRWALHRPFWCEDRSIHRLSCHVARLFRLQHHERQHH